MTTDRGPVPKSSRKVPPVGRTFSLYRYKNGDTCSPFYEFYANSIESLMRGRCYVLLNNTKDLVILHHIARLCHNADDLAVARCSDLVHDLHRLDDAEGIALLHLLTDQHERRFVRRRRRIKTCADQRALHLRACRKLLLCRCRVCALCCGCCRRRRCGCRRC